MKRRFNWGCLVKILIVLGIILVLFLVILQCGGGSCIRKIDKSLPDTAKAPWEVTTSTHDYLAKEVVENGEGITMSGWYEQVNGKWQSCSGNITLAYDKYGEITVRRR